MRTGRFVALLAAAGALLVTAWFGLAIVQAGAVDRATTAFLDPGARPTVLRAARDGLGVAGTLRPGQDDALLRAQLDLRTGRLDQGLREATAVTRAEPDNLAAWRLVALVAPRRDPALAARAGAAVARLSPDVPAG